MTTVLNRKEIQSVECPWCKAQPAHECRSQSGNRLTTPQFTKHHGCHARRVRDAQANIHHYVHTAWPVGRSPK